MKMNIPVTTVGSQVYVHFSSTATSHFQNLPTTNQDDVHICGACKQNFSDINLFMEHKRAGCTRIIQKPPAASTLLGPSSLGYISTTSSSTSEDSTSPLGPPIFRVIVDGSNISMQQAIGGSKMNLPSRENGDSQILRSRLLGIQNDRQQIQQQIINNNNNNNCSNTNSSSSSNNTNSGNMQAIVMQQQARREFQIDEEAVATILANQLANEDVTSTSICHSNISPSKTAAAASSILVLGNMDNEFVLPEAREQLDLGSLTLPGEESVALELRADEKQCNSKSNDLGTIQTSSNQVSNMSARKRVSTEIKDKLWPQSNGKEIANPGNVSISLPPPISSTSSSTIDLSPLPVNMSRTRAKKRHDCTYEGCEFSTCYLKDLVRHMRRHTGERPFRCETCQRSFSRGDKLQMHLRIHSGLKPHRCDQCGYATIDSGSLRKHLRIHSDERPYKCQICPYRSRDSSQLTVHLRTHTGDNPFVCRYESCSSAFKTSSDLKRHARMHTGEKPFACELCDYKCAIKSNLRVHLRLNHTELKSIPCSSCSHVSISKRAAKEHEKIHVDEVLKCGVCAYTCISTTSMKSHLRIHTQDKPFSCKHCSYTCRQQGNLKSHMKKKHPDLRVSKKGKNNVKDALTGKPGTTIRNLPKVRPFCVKSYRCTCCDAAFVREDSWRSHMRQHQTQDTSFQNSISGNENNIGQEIISELESCKQQANVSILQTDNLQTTTGLLQQEHFMLSINGENQNSKEPAKLDEQLQKSKEITSVPESVNGSKEIKDSSDKLKQVIPQEDHDQSLLLYVQNSSTTEENTDDSLRNAEILASLNQGAPILLTSRYGQYFTLPSDQNLMEQLAATLQPGVTYQYVLSSSLEGMVDNDGSFIQATGSNDNELISSDNTTVHIPSLISLHMEKQSVVEEKH